MLDFLCTEFNSLHDTRCILHNGLYCILIDTQRKYDSASVTIYDDCCLRLGAWGALLLSCVLPPFFPPKQSSSHAIALRDRWLLAYSVVEEGIHHFEVSVNIPCTWSISTLNIVVDCGTLTNPANSQVSYTGRTTFGQTAIYSCNAGYNMVGNSTRTCHGIWSGSEPTCQGVLLSLVLFTGVKYLVLFIHLYEFEVK